MADMPHNSTLLWLHKSANGAVVNDDLRMLSKRESQFFFNWCLTLLGAYVVMPRDGKALVPKER